MTENGTPNGSLPGWLRAAVYLGVPSVIALFLVWVLTQAIALRLAHIEAQITLQQQSVGRIEEAIADLHAVIEQNQTRLNTNSQAVRDAVQRLCVVLAHDADERADCIPSVR